MATTYKIVLSADGAAFSERPFYNYYHRPGSITISTAEEITDKGVRCTGPDGEVFIEADTVAYALGMKARKAEAMSFYDVAPVFHMVGDCVTSATILNATGTAYTAAKYLGRFN